MRVRKSGGNGPTPRRREREKFLGGEEEITKGNSCNLSLLLALCEGRGVGGGRKKLPKCFLAARRVPASGGDRCGQNMRRSFFSKEKEGGSMHRYVGQETCKKSCPKEDEKEPKVGKMSHASASLEKKKIRGKRRRKKQTMLSRVPIHRFSLRKRCKRVSWDSPVFRSSHYFFFVLLHGLQK